MTDPKNIFSAAALTATSTTWSIGDASSVRVIIVNAGFSGTLDIQGSLYYGGTYVNLPYTIVAAGATASAVAQLSYTTNSATHHIVVLAPLPFLKFVMTRSAGTITLDAWPTNIPVELSLTVA